MNTLPHRNIIKDYPDDKFIELYLSSYSICDIIRKIGMNVCGAQYAAVRQKVAALNLDKNHFNQTRWQKNRNRQPTKEHIPLSEILVENSTYACVPRLKKLLVSRGLFSYNCAICGVSSWRDAPLSLQLDHINGKNTDNRIENLRFLCPNCHSQSPTYAGRNKRKRQ